MRILLTIIGISAVLGLQSCSEDFKVAAPYKQITVVAGILDRDESSHYIRIQRAFMDENKSAIDMSKNPDSSFFNNLSVKLYQYNTTDLNRAVDSVALVRVDMNNEAGGAYRKADPVNQQQFFTTPNYAYKFSDADWTKSHRLSPQHWYKLIIHNLDNNTYESSDIVGMVNTDSLQGGDAFYVPDFRLSSFSLTFARTANNARFRLQAYMPRNGRRAEGYIRFHYVDKNLATQQETKKYVDFSFDTEEGIDKPGVFELTTLNASIYAFLNSAIGVAPANTERYMGNCDVSIYAASPELYYYSTINQGQAGGLTSDNIQPNYTNFKSDNVIGILGSRGKRVFYNAPIDGITLDSLMSNPITVPLRIRGRAED